jgi:hypothetical protein
MTFAAAFNLLFDIDTQACRSTRRYVASMASEDT